MIRKKLLSGAAFMVVMLGCLGMSKINVYASTTYTDTEPNNISSEAQYVAPNLKTAAKTVSADNSLYRNATGNLTQDDEDWYRTSLYVDNDNYFDISGGTGTIYIDILDSSLTIVDTYTYTKNITSNTYNIEIEQDGLYYIRLYHANSSIKDSYNFTIGEPKYKLSSYVYDFGSQTLPAKGEWEKKVNLSLISSLPNRAIGYQINVGGCTTSVSSNRYFFNDFYNNWVATKSTYSYGLPVTDSSKLDQLWGVKYKSSSTSSNTFVPTFTIFYVYPDIPQ